MLRGLGIETGIDLDLLVDAAKYLRRARPQARVAFGQCAARQAGGGSGGGMSAVPGETAATLPEGFRRVAAASPRAAIRTRRSCSTRRRAPRSRRPMRSASASGDRQDIVFRRVADGAAVLVVTSGDKRVDEAKVAARVGAVGRADADFVKAATSFAIGGVAPSATRRRR